MFSRFQFSRIVKAGLAAAFLAVLGLATFTPTHAAINKQINFQGRLTDSSGNIVGDGTYNMEFKLHSTAATSGGGQGVCSGDCLWMETRTGASRVTVSRGLFSIQLGEVASLSSFNFYQDPLYLSVMIGGVNVTPSWDAEMTPRHRLGAAPQAITSDNVQGYTPSNSSGGLPISNGTVNTNLNSDLLDGQHGSYYQNASNINAGTIGTSYLPGTVAYTNINNNFSTDQSVTGKVTVSSDLQYGNNYNRSLTRTLPTVVNDEVDIGSFTFTNGGGSLLVNVTVPSASFSSSKQYNLPIAYNETAGSWTIANPISGTGIYVTNDYALDVNVNGATTSLRLRRTAGSTAGTAYVSITNQGIVGDTFTPSTATSSVAAPAAYYGSAVLTETDGNVGIGVASTTNNLEVRGASGATVAVSTTTGSVSDSAYYAANTRARFGYSNGNIIIDDNGSQKGLLVTLNNGAGSDSNVLQFAGTTGAATFKPTAGNDSTAAFRIQNAAGTNTLMTVDTTNQQVTVGRANVGTVTGNRIFSDNFETGTFGLWNTIVGSPTIDTTTVFAGKYSEKVASASAAHYVERQITGSSTMYARGYVYVASQGATNATLFTLYNATDTLASSEITLYRQSGGNLAIWSGPAGGPCLTDGALSTGAWHKVEMKVVISNTGSCQLTVDDGTPTTSGTVDTLSANNPNRFKIGTHNTTETYTGYFDEFAVDTVPIDNAGSLTVQDTFHAGGTATFSAPTLVQPAQNSTTAFMVQNAAGAKVLTVDTSNQEVGIGAATTGSDQLYVQSGTDVVIHGKNTGSANLLVLDNNTSTVFTVANSGATTIGASTTALTLSGTPAASATSSLVQVGAAIAGGNAVANGGTYLGINLPASGSAGSAADFANFQKNGSEVFKIGNSGNIEIRRADVAAAENSGLRLATTNGNDWKIYQPQSASDLSFWTDAGGGRLAATLNTAGQLQLPVQGSTGGLTIGGDTALYRGGTDTLFLGQGDSLRASNANSDILGLQADAGSVYLYGNSSAASDWFAAANVNGDTNPRFITKADGTMNWGPGSAGTDTTLRRSGSGTLVTDGWFEALGGSFLTDTGAYTQTAAATSGDMFLQSQVTGDSVSRFRAYASGSLEWGPGNAARDTNLYRSAANTLKTDDTLNVVTGYQINGTAGASVTCTGGQMLSNQVVSGGITTGGTCAAGSGGGWTDSGTVVNLSTSTDAVGIGTSTVGSNKLIVQKSNITATSPILTVDGRAGASSSSTGNLTIMGARTASGTDVSVLNLQQYNGTTDFTGGAIAIRGEAASPTTQTELRFSTATASTTNTTPALILASTNAATFANTVTVGSISADPAGTNGAMYYNTTSNKFRCYENSAWKNCDDPWTYLSVNGGSDFTTSSASAVDVTGLAITPAASKNYEMECTLEIRTATTTVNPRVGFAWSTGLTDGVVQIIESQSAAGTPVFAAGNPNASVLAPAGTLADNTGSWPVTLKASFVSGATPSGTTRVQLASETALTNVTIKAVGSFCKYRTY